MSNRDFFSWKTSPMPCAYCGDENNEWERRYGTVVIINRHRIYARNKDKGRKFIPIGYYCTRCKLFELDKSIVKSRELRFKAMKFSEAFCETLKSVPSSEQKEQKQG